MRILKHDTLEDKQGHHYDLYWVEIEAGTNEIGTADEDRLPTIASVAGLTDGIQTDPTVSLFYQSTGIRVEGATTGDRLTIVARRDVGTPAGGTSIPPARFA